MKVRIRVIFYAHSTSSAYTVLCAIFDGRRHAPPAFRLSPEAGGFLLASAILLPLLAAFTLLRIPSTYRPLLVLAHGLITLAQFAGLVSFIG